MHDKEILYKVVAFLNRDELDFLDQVMKDLFFSTGKKIPRSELIKEIIHLSQTASGFKEGVIDDLKEDKGVHHA